MTWARTKTAKRADIALMASLAALALSWGRLPAEAQSVFVAAAIVAAAVRLAFLPTAGRGPLGAATVAVLEGGLALAVAVPLLAIAAAG